VAFFEDVEYFPRRRSAARKNTWRSSVPRPERAPEGSNVARITPPARKPYSIPKPYTKKAIPEGYALFAANGNEIMRFVAAANTIDFPEGRTLEEANTHADRMLAVLMGASDVRAAG
jgi:hypothetical protein